MKYLKNKKAFKVIWKAFFMIFKDLSIARNRLRPDSVHLSINIEHLLNNNKLLKIEHVLTFPVFNITIGVNHLKSLLVLWRCFEGMYV